MKIVVLAGGLSPERNVSLSSGSKVCQAPGGTGDIRWPWWTCFLGWRIGAAVKKSCTQPRSRRNSRG